jgi:hypothetical protein
MDPGAAIRSSTASTLMRQGYGGKQGSGTNAVLIFPEDAPREAKRGHNASVGGNKCREVTIRAFAIWAEIQSKQRFRGILFRTV